MLHYKNNIYIKAICVNLVYANNKKRNEENKSKCKIIIY